MNELENYCKVVIKKLSRKIIFTESDKYSLDYISYGERTSYITGVLDFSTAINEDVELEVCVYIHEVSEESLPVINITFKDDREAIKKLFTLIQNELIDVMDSFEAGIPKGTVIPLPLLQSLLQDSLSKQLESIVTKHVKARDFLEKVGNE